MNRKQRKAKQQRANQHRKVAKTAEYKRKQSDALAEAYREHDRRLNCHWLDEPIEGMRMMTDGEWRAAKIKGFLMFVGFGLLLAACFFFFDWVSP
ncbi:MAG: hypothetical protein ACEQSD_02065 [Flavobacteriales bacterium]